MTQDTQIPDPAAIRARLRDTFTPETLRRFCLDRPQLRPILDYLGPKYNLHDMIDEVITYCDKQRLWDEFLAELDQYDPSLYAAAVPILTTPFNLPAGLADFTGRQAEIDQVRGALSREGAVAISGIHGMGGIGKTALVLHVAHQLAAEGRFQDAQLYLDLKGTDPVPVDPAAALQALLSALLGPDPQRPTDVEALSDLWRRAIHGKDAVLVLDNVADVGQVRPLLPGCPTCAVLITSRRRFVLPGAGLLDLDPMDPGDARALLQRLAARLHDDEADVIAEQCGHLPMALRVAGNYLALNDDVSPDRYAALLSDERDRLARLRDPDDPDLDVEITIALSVAQLDQETRQAWALLALLPAPFHVAAAAALWGNLAGRWRLGLFRRLMGEPRVKPLDEEATLSRLQALRNRSLVVYDSHAGRYHQHDLMRLAAGRELADSAASEIPAARERHARHYLAIAQEVRDTQRYLDLDPDWPHLRAALEHAADSEAGLLSDLVYALYHYWSARGLAREWATWGQRAVGACAEARRRQDEGAHLGALGLAYADLGEVQTAIEQYEAALRIARKIGDRQNEGNWLGSLGLAYADLGEVRKAIGQYEAALRIARGIGDRRNEAIHLGNLGRAYAELGEVREAIERCEQALAISQEIGDRRNEGIHLGNLGRAYTTLGEVQKAIEQCEQALAISQEIGDRRAEGNAQANLGLAYQDLGESARARECWTQALAIFEAIEDPRAEQVRVLLAGLED